MKRPGSCVVFGYGTVPIDYNGIVGCFREYDPFALPSPSGAHPAMCGGQPEEPPLRGASGTVSDHFVGEAK